MIDPKTLNIPKSPGVYIFKNSSGTVLYIGKAKNLADRVKSYFAANLENPKTASMVSNAQSIEFIRTNTELEALLLESSLIKSHYPKYNIDLKDAERYSYLKLTDEKFPRLLMSRRNRHGRFSGPPGTVFGPFAQGSPKVLTVGAMRKIFKIRTCKTLPKKPCLQYHMGNCEAPCAFTKAQENYANHVALLKKTLSSKSGIEESVAHFTSDMEKASKARNFELAKMYRDSAHALFGLLSRQSVESDSQYNEDYFAMRIEREVCHVHVFNVQRGVVKQRKKFAFDLIGSDSSPLDEFALSYYQAGNIPKFIYSHEPLSKPVLEMLSSQSGFKVESIVPQKGDHSRLLEMLEKNLMSDLNGNAEPSIIALQEALKLEKPVRVIECFDISTMQGASSVGSMSRFVDGRPDKSGYRKFKIKTVIGQDDFASIEEIVYRRYKRLLEENRSMPDLVLIDGGAGQLASAFNALSRLNLDLECISIAKEFEEIYSAKLNAPLRLAKNNAGLKLLQHARDEAHRFGINYHRKLRSKKMFPENKGQ